MCYNAYPLYPISHVIATNSSITEGVEERSSNKELCNLLSKVIQ
ncbi:17668_t:CDS:2, partial [Racocetra persica]